MSLESLNSTNTEPLAMTLVLARGIFKESTPFTRDSILSNNSLN